MSGNSIVRKTLTSLAVAAAAAVLVVSAASEVRAAGAGRPTQIRVRCDEFARAQEMVAVLNLTTSAGMGTAHYSCSGKGSNVQHTNIDSDIVVSSVEIQGGGLTIRCATGGGAVPFEWSCAGMEVSIR